MIFVTLQSEGKCKVSAIIISYYKNASNVKALYTLLVNSLFLPKLHKHERNMKVASRWSTPRYCKPYNVTKYYLKFT